MASATQINKADYIYNNVGNRTSLTDRRGVQSFGYDAIDRLTSTTHPLLLDQSFSYDAVGNRTTNGSQHNLGNQLTEDAAFSYAYDANGNLTRKTVKASGNHTDYTYDAAGNRVSLTRANGTASLLPSAVQAAYDAANEQTKFGNPLPPAANLVYDENGNLTQQTDASGTTTYVWDKRNRLKEINGPGVAAVFAYDALGRRVSKTINTVTTQFLYDGNDIVQEIGGGAVGAGYMRSLSIDEPFVRQGAGSEFYHADALGNTFALSNAAGTTPVSYAYEAFGKTAITGSSQNQFQYIGRENDGTGLYYYRARYYSSVMQRFINEDPIGIAGDDINFYAYVENSPTNYVDPLGLIRLAPGIGGMPPRAPVTPVRPNIRPQTPPPKPYKLHRVPVNPGSDYLPKQLPWWIRLWKMLAGGDDVAGIGSPIVPGKPSGPSTEPAIDTTGMRKDSQDMEPAELPVPEWFYDPDVI